MKGSKIMKKGFTLAEVLITLAIIGVVAALTIPSVILNTNQTEYKTALKKAVSVLNQATSLELATNNISPSDVTSAGQFMQIVSDQMNIIGGNYSACEGATVTDGAALDATEGSGANNTCYFTTTDGMQFTIPSTLTSAWGIKGHDAYCEGGAATSESACTEASGTWKPASDTEDAVQCTWSEGAKNGNACYMIVDVNGSKAPNKMTTSDTSPSDRFVIKFEGANGTTISPAGAAKNIMFK